MPISSVLINFILFIALGWFIKKNQKLSKIMEKIVYGGAVVSLIWMLLTAVSYLFAPIFFDHAAALEQAR
jgi:hypothetical protein